MTENTKAFIKLLTPKGTTTFDNRDIPLHHLAAFADHLEEIEHPAAIAVNHHFNLQEKHGNPDKLNLDYLTERDYTTHHTSDPESPFRRIDTTLFSTQGKPGAHPPTPAVAVSLHNYTDRGEFFQRDFDAPLSMEEARTVADRMGEHKDAAHKYLDETFGKHKYAAKSYPSEYEHALKSENNVPQQ